jgi:UDP-N-acetyl-D-galactosamine dehydrogenase
MAQRTGYHSEVILAGRRINDNMGRWVAQRMVKQLVNANVPVKGARVGVLGLTFKEDVNDIRNSKVPTIVHELKEFGVEALLHDPQANAAETRHEYDLELSPLEELRALDGLILAVSHKEYLAMGVEAITGLLRDGGVFMDVKSAFEPSQVGSRVRYWSL